MIDTDKLAAQLELHEGRRRKPYADTVGKTTIGIGRNLIDVGLSDDEIDLMLAHDINRTIQDLDIHLPWWRQLDEVRARVLVDMAFNMGVGNASKGLLSFRNTLNLVEEGMYALAANNMLASKWARQVGRRAIRLADMMRTGQDYTK
jgi:lysozyme